jgi:hypothetical protein
MPFFSRKEAPAPINLSDIMEENEYDRPKRNRYGISQGSSSQGGKLRRKRVTRNKRRYGRKSRKHGRKSRRH